MATRMSREEIIKWTTDAARYQEMIGTAGWDRYMTYMEKEEQDAVERLLAGGNPEFGRGYVAALRFAREYPKFIIETMNALRKEG